MTRSVQPLFIPWRCNVIPGFGRTPQFRRNSNIQTAIFFLGGSAEVEELDSRIAFQLRHRDGLHKEKMAEMQEKYSYWVAEWCGFHKGFRQNHWEKRDVHREEFGFWTARLGYGADKGWRTIKDGGLTPSRIGNSTGKNCIVTRTHGKLCKKHDNLTGKTWTNVWRMVQHLQYLK